MRVIRSKWLQEKTIIHTTSNGANILFVPKKGFQKKYAAVFVNYGSVDLKFNLNGSSFETPPGIAHFLEHQLFKKNDMDALAEFGKYGAQSNAYTDYTTTCYYFLTTDKFYECLYLLLDFVFTPDFDSDRVERERSIIIQELLMYRDSPFHRCYYNLMENLYIEHPAKLEIGGTPETVKQITREQIESCYKTFYSPKNVFVVISGNVDDDKTMKIADKLLNIDSKPPTKTFKGDPNGVVKQRCEETTVISTPHVVIGIKDTDIPSDPKKIIVHEILKTAVIDIIFGKVGHFYNKAYTSGIIDDSFSAGYRAEPTFAFTTIQADTPHIDKFIEMVQNAIKRARKESFKNKDIVRIRKRAEGRVAKSFDSPESSAAIVAELHQRGVTLKDIPDLLDMVKQDALEETLEKLFVDSNTCVSILNPA